MTGNNLSKRLLVLTSTFPRWKDDVDPPFVYELCHRMASLNIDIDVLAPHTKGSKTFEILGPLNVFRYRYSFSRAEKLAYSGGILSNLKNNRFLLLVVPFFFTAQLFYTWKMLRKGNYDAVHAHWIFPQGFIAVIATRLAGKSELPVICTSHGGDLFALNSILFKSLKRWTLEKLKLLVVVSTYMKRYCEKNYKAGTEIVVCSMGVDLKNRFIPPVKAKKNINRLIFVGRLVEKKGVKHLLYALRDLVNENPLIHLDIVGNGPEKEDLLNIIREQKLHENVTMHGSVSNKRLPDFYKEAAIAIIPSIIDSNKDQEGLGLVVIEAMGCECVVVASSLDAIKDIITDGVDGLLCTPADANSIKTAVSNLLSDPDLVMKLAQRGRETVLEKYDWQIVANEYAQIIKNYA